ncbi:DUF6230 family protein [Natrialba taiwanensis]|uniref:Uncharacterized protein n=1 Tax=Natrialba taiwanensis DSM 12281 TaxID=1230458 RepID=M0ACD7_9EURY|nr:DUF6230 family protein [Natrialba taiwanensis]ELY95522.1 hypothetical protein C484_04515 [Natrialba taiwanensis DSM 12281]
MYNKKRLLTGTGASFLAVAFVALIVLSSGTAYAAPLAAGGFTIEADEIRSDEFLLYPGVGESSEAQATPVVVVEQRGVEIDGLVLTKEQSVDNLPGIDGTIEISFTTDETVEADEQYIKLTGLSAEEATFNGQVINDQYSDDPNQQFQQAAGENAEPEEGLLTDVSGDAPGMVQEDVEIEMVYLASNEISLPGLDVDVEYTDEET